MTRAGAAVHGRQQNCLFRDGAFDEWAIVLLQCQAIEPGQTFQKTGTFRIRPIRQKQIDKAIHICGFSAGGVGCRNDQICEGNYGLVLMIVEDLRLPSRGVRPLRNGFSMGHFLAMNKGGQSRGGNANLQYSSSNHNDLHRTSETGVLRGCGENLFCDQIGPIKMRKYQTAGFSRSFDGDIADVEEPLTQALIDAYVLYFGELDDASGLSKEACLHAQLIAGDGCLDGALCDPTAQRDVQHQQCRQRQPRWLIEWPQHRGVDKHCGQDEEQNGQKASQNELGAGTQNNIGHALRLYRKVVRMGSHWADAGPYLMSLPERVVRSAAALAGGLLLELGEVTIPAGMRRTKTYQVMAGLGLRFLIEQVGQVDGVYPKEGELSNDFILRRAAGHGIELAGILAFHASPVWIMAALADVTGAGRQILHEIAQALKQEGLLAADARFESVNQILDGLEETAGRATNVINSPPVDVAGLRREWREFQKSARKIPPRHMPSPDAIWDAWTSLKGEATAQGRSVFELSSLIALSSFVNAPYTLRRMARAAGKAAMSTGQFFASGVLEHYQQTLAEIRSAGYLNYWVREFRPYIKAAALQFSPRRKSWTERLLSRELL